MALRSAAPLFAAVLALSAAAAAQDAPPAPTQDSAIVVTGTRPTDNAIADFVHAFTVAAPGEQLSRFEWAVCPMASGIVPAQKQAVADRIRRVAKAAGIRVAADGCRPNVLVIVTPDKKALIEALVERHPEYFSGISRSERRALANSPEPAAAWHLSGPKLDADGREITYDVGNGYAVNRTFRPPSRLAFASRPQFAAAVVVVDSHALQGLTITQLADYAAMRTLIRTDPTRLGKSAAPTILKVVGAPIGSEVPITLTHWDLGVLRALYASDPTLSARSQGSDMRRLLKKDLDRTGERGL